MSAVFFVLFGNLLVVRQKESSRGFSSSAKRTFPVDSIGRVAAPSSGPINLEQSRRGKLLPSKSGHDISSRDRGQFRLPPREMRRQRFRPRVIIFCLELRRDGRVRWSPRPDYYWGRSRGDMHKLRLRPLIGHACALGAPSSSVRCSLLSCGILNGEKIFWDSGRYLIDNILCSESHALSALRLLANTDSLRIYSSILFVPRSSKSPFHILKMSVKS